MKRLIDKLKKGNAEVEIKQGYYIFADICNNGDLNCGVVRRVDDYVYENLSNHLESYLLKSPIVKKLIKAKKQG